MSFKSLEEPELRALAVNDFGIEVPEGANAEEICAALVENGVTWEDAVKHTPVAAAKDKQVAAAKAVEQAKKKSGPRNKPVVAADEEAEPDALLRMMRENRRFDVRGYTFTKDNPFGLVDASSAEWIVENVEGFRYATPKEVKEFYS